MSQVHLHLLITHLPVFGSIIGAFVLGAGIWSKTNPTKITAYCIFIVSAIGAGIAYLTGEGAEEAVENIQGVSENMITLHENAAAYALISLIILGIFSLLALLVTYKNNTMLKPIAIAIFFVSFISFGLVAWTGYLGGQIRHTEISNAAVNNPSNGEKNEMGEKDDD